MILQPQLVLLMKQVNSMVFGDSYAVSENNELGHFPRSHERPALYSRYVNSSSEINNGNHSLARVINLSSSSLWFKFASSISAIKSDLNWIQWGKENTGCIRSIDQQRNWRQKTFTTLANARDNWDWKM